MICIFFGRIAKLQEWIIAQWRFGHQAAKEKTLNLIIGHPGQNTSRAGLSGYT
jgi:hypothetical protein